ncbi:MAG: hypothetical protein MMC33_010800, partial [Icmadophila ericetorum]|nr:hypothetical protein [Icmadophila ericetorum]
IALADEAIQDYSTFDEIEEIPPSEDGSLDHLRIKNEMLNVPFFQNVTSSGPTGKIQGAVSISSRTVALGHRAGNQENIGIQDIRVEVLVRAGGISVTLQSLPAEFEADLEKRADSLAIELEIEALKEKLRGVAIIDETQLDRVLREV